MEPLTRNPYQDYPGTPESAPQQPGATNGYSRRAESPMPLGTQAPPAETYAAPPTYVTPAATISPSWRGVQVVWLLLSVLETLLAIRFVLKLLAANGAAGFTSLVTTLTTLFVAPFAGVFPNAQARGSVLEVSTLLALIVYPLLAWIIVRAISALRSRWTPVA